MSLPKYQSVTLIQDNEKAGLSQIQYTTFKPCLQSWLDLILTYNVTFLKNTTSLKPDMCVYVCMYV